MGKLKITDTTLRDAHQSLFATRMKTEDMIPVAELIDNVGYHSLEVWGGATFDSCIRYLNEDPWIRLRTLRKHFKRTKLQMLLRGQNLVGYRHYPDDVVEAFVKKAVDNGLDIIRIFDALNDTRNMEFSMKVAKEAGAHVQGAISYTISPVHNIDFYLKMAKELEELGADSICIKDMAGLLTPYDAYELVSKLKKTVNVPIQMHSHFTSGMADMMYLKAIEAGADVIDTAISSLALSTSQPAIEPFVVILKGTEWDLGFDLEVLSKLSKYFAEVKEKRSPVKKEIKIDTNVLIYQIPGGMMSNLISQLQEQNALDRYEEVLKEIPRVREDLGYPPLVTPTSQIVGIQAVMNVLFGERYKVVSKEVKNYVKGYYGRPPAPIKEEIKKKIIGDEEPITVRPADLLPPELEKARKELNGYMEKEEDVLTYALFPQVAMKFFRDREAKKYKIDLDYWDSLPDKEYVYPI